MAIDNDWANEWADHDRLIVLTKRKTFEEGVKFAIQALRDIKESDMKYWSHSRQLKFAPVELSDYILIKYKREHKNEIQLR